ncbi:MAG: hypothetical protein ACP5NV_02990 [Candidatus Woesearchaeota archaeon]
MYDYQIANLKELTKELKDNNFRVDEMGLHNWIDFIANKKTPETVFDEFGVISKLAGLIFESTNNKKRAIDLYYQSIYYFKSASHIAIDNMSYFVSSKLKNIDDINKSLSRIEKNIVLEYICDIDDIANVDNIPREVSWYAESIDENIIEINEYRPTFKTKLPLFLEQTNPDLTTPKHDNLFNILGVQYTSRIQYNTPEENKYKIQFSNRLISDAIRLDAQFNEKKLSKFEFIMKKYNINKRAIKEVKKFIENNCQSVRDQ